MNFLDHDELFELTGYKLKDKQQMSLAQMGVKFAVNGRGHILVSRSVLNEPKPKKKVEPDWSSVPQRKSAA